MTDQKTKRELTDGFLRSVVVAERTDFSDTKVEGLQVRVSHTGKKTFAVRARAPSRAIQRVNIGSYPELKLAAARDLARELIVKIRQGADVAAERREARAPVVAKPTLSDIISEYRQVAAAKGLGIWTPSQPHLQPEAERCIRAVFAKLLERDLTLVSTMDLMIEMKTYRRVGRTGKGDTANGRVSKARLYLMPVLDWAAGRRRFRKVGAGRLPPVDAPDASETVDLAVDDPKILGHRERVLDEHELARILPLLTYPAPQIEGLQTPPEKDFRFIALRFILLTAPRVANVEDALWRDIDFARGIWTKPSIKNTKGKQIVRSQIVHLSDAALALLKALPGADMSNPMAHVFPNTNGGPLGNWTRFQKSLDRASGTSGWHRHDLRRTASTLLDQLGVDAVMVGRVLGHSVSREDKATATALRHYIMQKQIRSHVDAPMKTALNLLAEVYAAMEADGRSMARVA